MSVLVQAPPLSMDERIAHRQKLARLQEFTILGRFNMIVFDPRGLDPPRVERPILNPNHLDWMDRGPWLGLSTDQQDLLVISSVAHPPQLPDTRVHPPIMVEQKYSDLTRKRFKGFLVIQPVFQIRFKPKGQAATGLITASTGFDDTQMAFLVNPRTGEAHFVGGLFEIGIR